MTDKIDLTKYEGRTPGDWVVDDANPEMVAVLDSEGKYIYVSDSYEFERPVFGKDWETHQAIARANATFIADGPLILKCAIELEAEVERLTPAAENYQGLLDMYGVDWLQMWKFIDNLKAEVGELQLELLKGANIILDGAALRNELAGALESAIAHVEILINSTPTGNYRDRLTDDNIHARATLAKVRGETGGDTNGE